MRGQNRFGTPRPILSARISGALKSIGHMAELADALDLGSSGETRKSSSLFMPTNKTKNHLIFGNL